MQPYPPPHTPAHPPARPRRKIAPFIARPEPYVGLELFGAVGTMEQTAACGTRAGVGYKLFMGMNGTVGIGKFGFEVWGKKIEFGGSLLPRNFTFAIVKKVGGARPPATRTGCCSHEHPAYPACLRNGGPSTTRLHPALSAWYC